MASRKRHPAELRERAVAMVFELRAEPATVTAMTKLLQQRPAPARLLTSRRRHRTDLAIVHRPPIPGRSHPVIAAAGT